MPSAHAEEWPQVCLVETHLAASLESSHGDRYAPREKCRERLRIGAAIEFRYGRTVACIDTASHPDDAFNPLDHVGPRVRQGRNFRERSKRQHPSLRDGLEPVNHSDSGTWLKLVRNPRMNAASSLYLNP